MMNMKTVKALGLVFGDIGTSPIYTFTVIFLIAKPTPDNITGALSLVIWTLVMLVTVEYSWLAMNLSREGEGGTIVLREILANLLRSKRQVSVVSIFSFIAISLFVGDGVITPAISILSAVEGLLLIPGLEGTSPQTLVLVAGAIAVALFFFQRSGSDKMARAFGPVMTAWFIALALYGILSIWTHPAILLALNPYYGISFLYHNGIAGFLLLSSVILCATGGEALYADMGHLGAKPIKQAWHFVFAALVLNYLGQGAFLLDHPKAQSIFFEMASHWSKFFYIPFLLLSILATIIASQAMISGMFSIVYQSITTRIMPLLKVDYTSSELRSQIYIGFVNWSLLVAVLFAMVFFQESKNLAHAYGLAVTGTMSTTGIMMSWIFLHKKKYVPFGAALLVTVLDLAFLLSNLHKIPHGAYWSLIIAAFPLAVILLYTKGQRRLFKFLEPMTLDEFLGFFQKLYATRTKIQGIALFFARDISYIPPYMVRTMFQDTIIYEDNIVVSIMTTNQPFGVESSMTEVVPGLRWFKILIGYLEPMAIEDVLQREGIYEKTIFYGVEDIDTSSIIWQIFSFIKKITPSYVKFFKLPSHKLHGVITRIEM